MTFFVGLGNPDKCYENTRHNIGFTLVERLAELRSFTWRRLFKDALLYSELQRDGLDGEKIYLLKPMSYMNCSGVPIAQFLRKKGKQEILVIHDDLDLALGRVKIKRGGSDGGHNGLRSIDAAIGRDYWRLRVGIGRPASNFAVTDYVLSRFSSDEKEIIDGAVERIASKMDMLYASDGLQQDNVAKFLDKAA